MEVIVMLVVVVAVLVLAAVVIVLLVRFTGLRAAFVELAGDATVSAGLAEGQLEPRRPPPPVALPRAATDAPPLVAWNAALPSAPAWTARAPAIAPPATTDDDSSDETQILLSAEAIDAALAAQPARKGPLLGLAPTPEPPPSGSAPSKGAT